MEKKSVWKYYKGASRDRSTKNYDNPKEAYDAVAKGGGTVVGIKVNQLVVNTVVFRICVNNLLN